MSIQRSIVQKLYESKGLYEATFQSGGSTYKCVFGKYYKDDEEITRDDYFKAKEEGGISSSAPVSNNQIPQNQVAPKKKTSPKPPEGKGHSSKFNEYKSDMHSLEDYQHMLDDMQMEEVTQEYGRVADMLGISPENVIGFDEESGGWDEEFHTELINNSEEVDRVNDDDLTINFSKFQMKDGTNFVVSNNWGLRSLYIDKNPSQSPKKKATSKKSNSKLPPPDHSIKIAASSKFNAEDLEDILYYGGPISPPEKSAIRAEFSTSAKLLSAKRDELMSIDSAYKKNAENFTELLNNSEVVGDPVSKGDGTTYTVRRNKDGGTFIHSKEDDDKYSQGKIYLHKKGMVWDY